MSLNISNMSKHGSVCYNAKATMPQGYWQIRKQSDITVYLKNRLKKIGR